MENKKSIVLYNGEIEIDFYPANHWYKIGKEFIPSVTSITGQYDKSGALMYRACNLARDFLLDIPQEARTDEMVVEACRQHQVKKEEASAIGNLTHDRAEQWSRGEKQELPDDVNAQNGVFAFLQWVNEHDVEIIESETVVYSKNFQYVGTFDAVARIDGKKYLIDYKTSKGFHAFEYGMQLAGYRQAREEERGEKLDGMIGVHFDKETGDFKAYDLSDMYVTLLYSFNNLCQLRHHKKVLDKMIKCL